MEQALLKCERKSRRGSAAILGAPASWRMVGVSVAILCCMSGCLNNIWFQESFSSPIELDTGAPRYSMSIMAVRAADSLTGEKNVYITIKSGKRELMKREYRFVAGILSYRVRWNQDSEVEVVLYDLPDGISVYDKKAKQYTPRYIAGFRYTLNPQTGLFAESPLPWEQIENRKSITGQ